MADTHHVVVGTYLSERQANDARRHLQDRGIDGSELHQPADGVWQVRVAPDHAHAALRELEKHEEWAAEHY
jgi:hypothetical protein